MLYGIGCDIVEVARIENAARHDGFCRRAFSDEEREYYNTLKHPFESMAGAWAAKEAFAKALHTGVRNFSLNEITVAHDSLGAPYLKLSGYAKKAAEGLVINISISHTKDYAQAFCTLERKE